MQYNVITATAPISLCHSKHHVCWLKPIEVYRCKDNRHKQIHLYKVMLLLSIKLLCFSILKIFIYKLSWHPHLFANGKPVCIAAAHSVTYLLPGQTVRFNRTVNTQIFGIIIRAQSLKQTSGFGMLPSCLPGAFLSICGYTKRTISTGRKWQQSPNSDICDLRW